MGNIHIVIDSTANVSAELLEKYDNLHVASLKVILGQEEWPEDELPSSELFRLAEIKKCHPKTSQPALGDFVNIFEPLIKAGNQIVVVTVSGGLSGTVQCARNAANMVDAKNIRVVDSGTTLMAITRMAETALEMAGDGSNLDEIADHLEVMARNTYTLIVPNTLEYLQKGGRIGGAAALFGTILQIKPILYLVEGKVAVLDKVRTRPRAITRAVDELKKQERLAYIGVGYSECLIEAEALKAQLRLLYPDIPIIVKEIGSVLSSHLGPGLLGLIYQKIL